MSNNPEGLRTVRTNEQDFESYKQLLDLWSKENPIKTNKLQMLLLVNSLLLTIVQLNGGFTIKNWSVLLIGAFVSFVWLLSMGRTSYYQEIWSIKINEISNRNKDDSRFLIHKTQDYEINKISVLLRVIGCISSKFYVIGTPIIFSLAWFITFLCILMKEVIQ